MAQQALEKKSKSSGLIRNGLFLTAGLATAAFGGRYLYRLSTLPNKVNVLVDNIRIHRIALSGVTLAIRVTIQNPSPLNLRIDRPYVKISSKDTVLGISPVVNERIDISKQSQQSFELMIASVPYAQLVGAFTGSNDKTLPITIETITRVNGIGIRVKEVKQLNSPV